MQVNKLNILVFFSKCFILIDVILKWLIEFAIFMI